MSSELQRWLLSALAVVVVIFVVFFFCDPHKLAIAEIQNAIQDNGRVIVVPLQLEKDLPGLVMIDTVGQTLWVYEINIRAATHNKLKLLAARSWQYDRLLQQYNTADPTPEQVRDLLEKLDSSVQTGKEPVIDVNELNAIITRGPNSPEEK